MASVRKWPEGIASLPAAELAPNRMRDPTDRNMPARERGLWAAVALLVENGPSVVADGLSYSRVAERAGLSRPRLSEIFPDHAEFLRSALQLQRMGTPVEVREIADALETPLVSWSAFADLARNTARENFRRHARSWSVRLMILSAWLASADPEIAQIGRTDYETYSNAFSKSYGVWFERWGLAVRSPLTLESLTMTLAALAEGFALRSEFDDRVTPELFGDAVLAFLSYALVDRNDPLVDQDAPLPRAKLIRNRGDRGSTRSAIISATIALASKRGVRPLDLGEIAEAVGTDQETLVATVGGVDSTVVAVWADWAPAFASAHRADLRERQSDGYGLRRHELAARHLSRIATEAMEHPELAAAFLSAVARADLGVPNLLDLPLAHSGLLSPLLDLPPTGLAPHTAEQLVWLTLRSALQASRTGATAEAVAESVLERRPVLDTHHSGTAPGGSTARGKKH